MSCEQQQQMCRQTHNAFVGVFLLAASFVLVPGLPATAAEQALVATRVPVCPRCHRMRIRCFRKIAQRFERRSGFAACEPGTKTSIAPSKQVPTVAGTVTKDGNPVDRGIIEFRAGPDSKDKIRVEIRDGRYFIPEGPLAPGQYRVEIPSELDPANTHPAQDGR